MESRRLSCMATVLLLLLLVNVSAGQTEHREQHLPTSHQSTTKGDVLASTLSSTDTIPETSDDSIETSATTSPENSTDTTNVNNFSVVLYFFAVIGLMFSTICLIQTIRSYCSVDCGQVSHDDHDSIRLSRRCSWRGRSNSRSYKCTHIIAV